MLLNDPVAARTFRRVALCFLGTDLFLIGLHAAMSAAAMAGWVEGVPTAIRITRPQSFSELFDYAKWSLTAICLMIIFLRTRRIIFGSLAVIFTFALLNDIFSFHASVGNWLAHASLGDGLAGYTGPHMISELMVFTGFGALALGLLAPGFRGLSPELRGLAVRFVAMLVGLAAFGAVLDFANSFVPHLDRLASKSGTLIEEGGEMLFASGAAAYAIAAWYSIGRTARASDTHPPTSHDQAQAGLRPPQEGQVGGR